jgi:hypothetical protein
MTATNHALTGALIGLTVHNPWVALPAALFSHIICDIIPHFALTDKNWLKRRSFTQYLILDASLCLLLVGLIFAFQPGYWQQASVCAFLATSPDLLWIRQLVFARQNRSYHRFWLERFLGWIQWFQRPVGAFVELAWFVGAGILLWQFL